MNIPPTQPVSGLAHLMSLSLSPVSPQSAYYRCNICWETSKDINDFIEPCGCKNDMRYAHERCVQQWVKCQHRYSCAACCQIFKIQVESQPYGTIFKRHASILGATLLQIILPIVLYLRLYCINGLEPTTEMQIRKQLAVLAVIYACMGFCIYKILKDRAEQRGKSLIDRQV